MDLVFTMADCRPQKTGNICKPLGSSKTGDRPTKKRRLNDAIKQPYCQYTDNPAFDGPHHHRQQCPSDQLAAVLLVFGASFI